MVLGASFDPVDDNRAFAEKFDYPFRLLSDLDEQVGVAYAVRDAGTDKINFAKRYAYLIGPDGVIVGVASALTTRTADMVQERAPDGQESVTVARIG